MSISKIKYHQVLKKIYVYQQLSPILIITLLSSCFQEDLTPKDIEEIIDELKAGRVPPPGPR